MAPINYFLRLNLQKLGPKGIIYLLSTAKQEYILALQVLRVACLEDQRYEERGTMIFYSKVCLPVLPDILSHTSYSCLPHKLWFPTCLYYSMLFPLFLMLPLPKMYLPF